MQAVNLVQSLQFFRNPVEKKKTSLNSRHSVSRKNSRAHNDFSVRCYSTLNIADVLHNKALVTAVVSAAIGQLSKPITSVLFYGKKFNFKDALQAGGFPSTHSSSVVAAATCLALERGFSDSIFGLAFVYAGLFMYDAQGVRREVGTHAKELNKVLVRTTSSSTSSRIDANGSPNSFPRELSPNLDNGDTAFLEEQSSLQTRLKNSSVMLKSNDDRIQSSSFVRSSDVVYVEEESETAPYGRSRLKESIGHTEVEVAAGAVLGFIVSLALFPLL